MISKKIENFKEKIFAKNYFVSLDASILYTKSYKNNSDFSYSIRHALAIANVLQNIDISIDVNEPIIGNMFSKSNFINVFPQISPEKLYTLLDSNSNNIFMSSSNKNIYEKDLYSYWNNKSFENYINEIMDNKVENLEQINLIKLNNSYMTNIDFKNIINTGLNDIIIKFQQKSNQYKENDFYRSSLIILTAIQKYIIRYSDLAYSMAYNTKNIIYKKHLLRLSEISRKISYSKPNTFYEACQLIWYLCVIFQYELGNASINLGCFDQYMIDFYEKDIKNGIDSNFLTEILSFLFIKLNKKYTLFFENDTLNFNTYNMTIGGTNNNGNSSINSLSFLILDIYKNLNLPYPKLNIRINEFTEETFLNKLCDYTQNFSTINFFNDEIIVPSLLNKGIPLEDCRNYSIAQNNSPCVSGKTFFVQNNILFDFNKLLQITLNNSNLHYNNFEKIIIAVKESINRYLALTVYGSNLLGKSYLSTFPLILISCFSNNYLETGKPIYLGGSDYNFSVINTSGIEFMSAILCYLNESVFIKKTLTLNDSIFEIEESLNNSDLIYFLNKISKYNISNDTIYNLACDLLKYFIKQLNQYTNPLNGTFLASAYVKHSSFDYTILKNMSKLDNILLNENKLEVKLSPSYFQTKCTRENLFNFLKNFIRFKIQNLEVIH